MICFLKKILIAFLSVVVFLSSAFLFSCKNSTEKETFYFYAPDGAPSLSVAKLIHDNENFGTGKTFNYEVVSSSNIGGLLGTGKGDFVIIPVNAASKLYAKNKDDTYKMVSVVTHGNLYIVSKESLGVNDLKGKVVGVIGQGLVPDLTFKAVLSSFGLEYEAGDSANKNKVTLKYFAEASEMLPMLKQGKISVGLLPEPALTKLQTSIAPEYEYTVSIQELFDSEKKSYPQAVLMVKSSILKEYPDIVKRLKEKFDSNAVWIKDNIENAINSINSVLTEGIIPSLTVGNVTPSVIENCKIYWGDVATEKQAVINYINKIRTISSVSADEIIEDFFWE